ncbi:MAG: UV DNA damage repair endonuclease UvsE [Clostridiales bacterium]|jgi:UV DNA damage endonuclease|nr:UV DNA damage repair endonuclease UvsE [Clostridiales bacterium]
MLVYFGFVAISMTLEHASPSKAVTHKTYRKLYESSPDTALEKVRQIARENLTNCLRLLHYCAANHVRLYRFSSKIIPLATHPDLVHWGYLRELKQPLAELGRFIRKNGIRVSFHPDHYTLINSPREEVFTASVTDLAHHCLIFNAMGLDDYAKLIIHVGGGYNDKESSLERFLENWARIPNGIAKRLTLENDDKTFTARETLYLCEKLQIPFVFDVHHHTCNHEEDSDLEDILPRFIRTWENTGLRPKLHISSPRSETDFRSHHDFINPDDIYPILKILKEYPSDFDVMVEAKQKDLAMFRLVKELGRLPGIDIVNSACISIP